MSQRKRGCENDDNCTAAVLKIQRVSADAEEETNQVHHEQTHTCENNRSSRRPVVRVRRLQMSEEIRQPQRERSNPRGNEWSPVVRIARFDMSTYTGAEKREQFSFHDVPDNLVQLILGYVHIWHHNRIRAASRRLRDLVDVFVLHDFKKRLRHSTCFDPEGKHCATLQTIKYATEVYVESGFASIFSGCLLEMMRSAYVDPFHPSTDMVIKCLLHFYETVDKKIGGPRSRHSHLLYNLTLMNLLKRFSRMTILSSTASPLYWRAVIELVGPWFSKLYASRNQSKNPRYLVVLLSEILIADKSGECFKRIWKCCDEIYVLGNQAATTGRIPKTEFALTVHGSNNIPQLIRQFLEEEHHGAFCTEKFPRDRFIVSVDITCKDASKWGCQKVHHLQFEPLPEEPSNDEGSSDQEENLE